MKLWEINRIVNTHGMIIDFGRHKGALYTRVSVSYLKWMVQCNHSKADIAKAELNRRGTVTPDIEISGHAIDSASLRLRKQWYETSDKGEGLHAWLCRICKESLEDNSIDNDGCVYYNGIKLVFQPGEWPVLKTCMPNKK